MFYMKCLASVGIDVYKCSSMNVKHIFGDNMWYAHIPPELWMEIISFLEFRDVVKVHHLLKNY